MNVGSKMLVRTHARSAYRRVTILMSALERGNTCIVPREQSSSRRSRSWMRDKLSRPVGTLKQSKEFRFKSNPDKKSELAQQNLRSIWCVCAVWHRSQSSSSDEDSSSTGEGSSESDSTSSDESDSGSDITDTSSTGSDSSRDSDSSSTSSS